MMRFQEGCSRQKLSEILPYSESEVQESIFSEETNLNLTLESLQEVPGVLNDIREAKSQCQELLDQMAIDEIEEFGNKMAKLGDQYHCQSLANGGKNLCFAATSYKIDDISQSLQLLHNLADKLE